MIIKVINNLKMEKVHKCRAPQCQKKYASYEGRLFHEKNKHPELKMGGYNCGKADHCHK